MENMKERVYIFGRMEINMKEISKKIKFQEKVFGIGLMVMYMKVVF